MNRGTRMKSMVRPLALLAALALPVVASAAPAPDPAAAEPASNAQPDAPQVNVQTRVTPEPLNVGDVINYEITVGFPRGVTVNMPVQVDVAPLHFVERIEAPVEATGQALRKTFVVRLQHFDVGEVTVPAFDLTTVDASGAVQTVEVPATTITIEALLANEADPVRRGEDPPVSIAYPNTWAETAIYAALAGILLALFGWLVARRFLRRPKIVPAPPPIPAHEVALAALDDLEESELIERDDLVPFYLQLTEIAKGYLEGRFGVPALDRTTDEIRQALVKQSAAIAPLSPDEVIAFLQRCDLVKFARFAPGGDEAPEALGEVRTMVQRSIATPDLTATPTGAEAEMGTGTDTGTGTGTGTDTETETGTGTDSDSDSDSGDDRDADGDGSEETRTEAHP